MQTSNFTTELGIQLKPSTLTPKLGSHHFPVGTIFRTNVDPCLGVRSGKEYEVKGIVRNDVRNFVLETTTFDVDLEMNIGLSICHVDKIVKRGTGPIVICDSGFEKDFACDRINYIQNRLEIDKHFAICSGIKVRKNEFILSAFDFPGLVWLFSEERLDCSIDQKRVLACVKKSSLFRKGKNNFDETYYIIKKDKFKKWVKQNINRFYCSLDKLEKELEAIDKVMLDREIDLDDSGYGGFEENDATISNNQKRIDDLVEKAYADDVFKELDDALSEVETEQIALAVKQENVPLEKKHEEDF